MPQHWAGAFACWGLENREAALRMITGSAGSEDWAANLEVKCFDLSANPYLLLAGLLACGVAGMEGRLALPEPVDVDPAMLGAAERDRSAVTPLPATLGAALEAFLTDPTLTDALGPGLVEAITAVRRSEVELFAAHTPEEITAATRWAH